MRSNRGEGEAGDPAIARLGEQASAVRRAVMRLSRRLRQGRPARALSHAKLSILGHLQTHGELSATRLARLEDARLQSLTRVLADLERAGFITRITDVADRRRAIIRITHEGSRALSADMRRRDAWLAAAMAADLTPTEREVLALASDLMSHLAETSAHDQEEEHQPRRKTS
jgi:DNA-binding MarR family transcriptional regulator